jgi:hypothetical protein
MSIRDEALFQINQKLPNFKLEEESLTDHGIKNSEIKLTSKQILFEFSFQR